MEQERVRIVDIAEELGLSTATVSNVIHGKTKKVSEETIKRVQQLLEEREYIPSMAGMLLAQNNSRIIGIVINNHNKYEDRVLQDPFITSAIDYLAEEIEKREYFMMVRTTEDCQDIVRFSSMWNMEGIIAIGFCEEDYDRLRNGMHIPFVVYDGFQGQEKRYANISVDNFDGGYQMGKYLMAKGHENILFLADNDICMDDERYQGLCRSIQEEAECRSGEEREGYRGSVNCLRMVVPQKKQERMEYYEHHLAELLSYSVVFAASDVYAIELMNFLMEHKVRIPEDISIAGFDGISAGQMVRPGLTTMFQDNKMRAVLAMETLLKQKRKEPYQKHQVIPVRLVERESVGAVKKRRIDKQVRAHRENR